MDLKKRIEFKQKELGKLKESLDSCVKNIQSFQEEAQKIHQQMIQKQGEIKGLLELEKEQ